MFVITNILTEDNRVVTVKASPSTTLSEIKPKDLSIQSHSSLDDSDIKIQSGISSHVSNYINAWQLSKVTSAFQKSL